MNEHQPHQEHEQPPELQPRIWIASLADYNAGRLHGDWVDAAVDADDLYAAARSILASSHEPGAEEFAIFDSDEFGLYKVNEYDPLDTVASVARGIAEHGPAYAAWADLTRHDDPDRRDSFTDAYLGSYQSAEAWAEELISDLAGEVETGVADWLRPYVTIGYATFARDAEAGGEIEVVEHATGVWIFDGRA